MTELVFKGKGFVWNHHLAVPLRPFEMHEHKGIGPARLRQMRNRNTKIQPAASRYE